MSGAPSASRSFEARGTAALLALFVACAVFAALRRGPWLDEVWTLWQSQHDLPLADIVRERWMADFHPPLFSWLHWVGTAAGLGESLAAHRLLNLLALGWAVTFALFTLRRHPASARWLLVYAVLLLSLPVTLQYFAESRSYFMQLCFTYTTLVTAVVVLDRDDDLAPRRDAGWALAAAAGLVVALNLHYITTLLLGLVLVGLCLACLCQKRWRFAALFAGAGALAALPLFAYLWAQLPYLQQEAGNFWLTSSAQQGLRLLGQRVVASLRPNPVVAAVAAAALVAGAGALLRRRGGAWREPVFDAGFSARLEPAPARRRSLLLLAVALAAFAAAMLVLHVQQPVLSGRYLLTFQAAVLAPVACLAAEAVAARRVLYALALAFAAGNVVAATARTADEQRWDASAQLVSRWLADCRASPVATAPVQRQRSVLRNLPAALHWGTQWQARRHGFAVVDLADAPRAAGNACARLVWVEHAGTPLPDDAAAALARIGLELPARELARTAYAPGESGFVLKLPADTAPFTHMLSRTP